MRQFARTVAASPPAGALQLVQAIAGKIESLWNVRSVESGRNIFNPAKEISSGLTSVTPVEKSFQSPAPRALNLFEQNVE